MKTLGIIGGMGSGKSSVSQLLAAAGLPVLDLDVVGHEVLRLPLIKRHLVQVFGSDIIGEKYGDTQIDRAALAAKAFASPEGTAQLNAIVQPAIEAAARRWKQEQEMVGHAYAVLEISAFNKADSSYRDLVDYVVAVIAPDAVREKRACAGRFAIEDVRQRMTVQPSNREYQAWADFVIHNDGSPEDLRVHVADLLKKYHL